MPRDGFPSAPPLFPSVSTTDAPDPPGGCTIATRSMCRWNAEGPGTWIRIPITDRVTVVTASVPTEVDGGAFSKASPARWSPGAVPAGTRTVKPTVDRRVDATVIDDASAV